MQLVTLDLALTHGLAWEEVDKVLSVDTPKARFLAGK